MSERASAQAGGAALRRWMFGVATCALGCSGQLTYPGAESTGTGPTPTSAINSGAGTAGAPPTSAGGSGSNPAVDMGAAGSAAGVGPTSVAGGGAGSSGAAGGTTLGTLGTLGTGPVTAPSPLVPSVLARLTATQYQNTLRDLFAPTAIPDLGIPADISVEGFDNNASAQTPSAALIEAYHGAAVSLATAAMASPAQLLGCTPVTRADEDACATTFLASFGRRAFRHPLTATESSNLQAFYSAERTGGSDFNTAMTLTTEAILQSPTFLYRVELGTPIVGGAGASATTQLVQLTPYEMASRLSFLVWNTMPDEGLFAAAESGSLAAPDGLEAEARRLLADPRAHDAVANFHSQWLELSKINTLVKSADVFPTFTPATATAMRASADKFVDDIFFGDGTLTALLTDPNAWVNDTLAPLYGVPAPGSATLSRVPVDATQRSGILTNVGLLAGFAHETTESPVLRGVFVLDRLICATPPPPPPNVNTAPPAASPGVAQTTRQQFATQHEQGTCAGCHHLIDGVGFGFEHYDALGQWRTTDSGLPVDSSGWLPSDGDLSGTFDGAVELGQRLAASVTVRSCLASKWLRYALGVDHTGITSTQLQPIVDAFVASGSNMRELVVAIAKSDAFRTRAIAL
jgi:hypothetical protein